MVALQQEGEGDMHGMGHIEGLLEWWQSSISELDWCSPSNNFYILHCNSGEDVQEANSIPKYFLLT